MPQLQSIEPVNSPLVLSAEDVNRLLQDTTSGTRVDMTDRIAGAYSKKNLTPKEMLVAEQVFRLLVRDTEIRVRATLAQHVKESDRIPRDIVLTLARDVEEVALPVLQFSEVLTDDDLLDLISSTEEISRCLAISKRKAVSETISDTLLRRDHDQIISELVHNTGARISEHGFNKIIHEYKNDETMMEAITSRSHLPVATVEKLVNMVSSSLAEVLKQKYKLPTEHIEKEVEKTREKETLHLIKLAKNDNDIDKLIVQLQASDRLNPSLILSALCQGNFDFFEGSLAKLSTIPVANARKLITDKGELGFRAIYNKSGLPDAMFPAVKLLLKIVRELDVEGEKPGSSRYANRIVERILQYSEDKQMENLSYIIALVRKVAQ